jgi:hypothetical protein
LLLCVTPIPASADPPEGVVRTFAVLTNLAPEEAPDFLSEESVGVVVSPPDPKQEFPELVEFADSNPDERFNSTDWERRDALHITIGNGAQVPGNVIWLQTPDTPVAPPSGASTFTGSDSTLILNQEVLYYESFGTGYRIRSAPGGAGVLVMVTAVFSR